jgi:methionyl aminopeptidase
MSTEEIYGGDGRGGKMPTLKGNSKNKEMLKMNNKIKEDLDEDYEESELTPEVIEYYVKAGRIAAEARDFARKITKKDMLVLEIAEKVEEFIIKQGAQCAFPVDVSCGEIAAHYSPLFEDTEKARGIVKVDIGVSFDGYIVDTAVSVDVENSEENKKIIDAAEKALDNALSILKPNIQVREIGKVINETITATGLSIIRNLSGHSIKRYKIHAGITIPNYDNGNQWELGDGVYAIEPFATTGEGIVQDGKGSQVYMFKERKPVRDFFARQIIDYIEKEYNTMPFSSRWLIKKFGNRVLFTLSTLERENILHHFSQLVEKSRMPVSQAEHSFMIHKGKIIILTK